MKFVVASDPPKDAALSVCGSEARIYKKRKLLTAALPEFMVSMHQQEGHSKDYVRAAELLNERIEQLASHHLSSVQSPKIVTPMVAKSPPANSPGKL